MGCLRNPPPPRLWPAWCRAVETKLIGPQESVLVMITGSGLKDIRSPIRAGGEPLAIEPDLVSVAAAVENCLVRQTMPDAEQRDASE